MAERARETPEPLPSFLIIGAQKSGTRWLRHNLGLHQEVFAAQRELEFFNTDAYDEIGLEGYSEMFDGWKGEPIVGEATPGYMMLREDPATIAERINRSLPDVRLIAILRNPVDRIRSALFHHSQKGRLPAGRSPLSHLRATPVDEDPWGIVVGSWYASSLKPYVEIFGSRLLVLLLDDAINEPATTFSHASAHIGADASFLPEKLTRVRFSNLDTAVIDGEVMRTSLSPGERAVLMGHVRAEIDALEDLLGIDLDRWRLGGTHDSSLRASALQRILQDGEDLEKVAAEHSVSPALLRAWRDDAISSAMGPGR